MREESNIIAASDATEQVNHQLLELRTVADAKPEPLFINRDLSLVEFFRRVLEEAQDVNEPLLERSKFLAVLSSNLDEFFMIRVSSLKEKLGREVGVSEDGFRTDELLAEIRSRVSDLVAQQADCFREDLIPALAAAGISITTFDELTESERRDLNAYFHECVYPLLTPQAVDPTHPFPYISGGSLNIGLNVKPELNRRVSRALGNAGSEFFVRIKIPAFVPRFVPVGDSTCKFILIEDLIRANIRNLVPDASPSSCHLFRITRDGDISLRESEAQDLLETMEENLKLRRFGDVLRLEIADSMPAEMADHLKESLGIAEDDIYRIDGLLEMGSLFELYKLNRQDLKVSPVKPIKPSVFDKGGSTFDIIKAGDVLLHHPYMPYSIVTDFIREAVADPDVLAIKMCLYRIGSDSPIAPLLIEASERGKQVTVVIEIKARFDEANNIEWAKRLEEAGVHVTYGLLGLKTHCKTTLIIRREEDALVRYVHIATGNYNPETSAFYTDLGLLTTDPEIGEDATELFNYLTVYARGKDYKRLVVAPIYLREKMVAMIECETDNARKGIPARIVAKMNRLADTEIVRALYAASQAGVEIDLIVRGVCTLRPGVPGVSENIRVRSIVGQLLEHSRAYYFHNGGDPVVFTGSSDFMPRNLDRRVEVLAPVREPEMKQYLINEFLNTYLTDTVKARELGPDGSYSRVTTEHGQDAINSQLSFQERTNIVAFSAVNELSN